MAVPETSGPLSIAFVIARYPPALGGTERQAYLLARAHRDAGCRVDVFSQLLSKETSGADDGVERLWPRLGGRMASAVFGVNLVWRLLRRRPDVIQAFLLSSPALFASLAGKLLNRPVAARLGGGGSFGDVATSRRRWASRLRFRLAARLLDHVTAPTREAAEEIVAAGMAARKVSVIPNGVATDAFAAASGPRRGPAARTIIFSGRLEAEKNLGTLLRAMAEVAKTIPEARLLIIGRGGMADELRRMSVRLDLEPFVTFAGERPHEEMPQWYDRASIFVLPSFSEGMSNALLEASAAGLAPVLSDIPGNRAVFGDSEALFFPPGDHDRLAGHLVRLLTDDGERERKAAAATERGRSFDISAAAAAYRDLYRRLAAEKIRAR